MLCTDGSFMYLCCIVYSAVVPNKVTRDEQLSEAAIHHRSYACAVYSAWHYISEQEIRFVWIVSLNSGISLNRPQYRFGMNRCNSDMIMLNAVSFLNTDLFNQIGWIFEHPAIVGTQNIRRIDWVVWHVTGRNNAVVLDYHLFTIKFIFHRHELVIAIGQWNSKTGGRSISTNQRKQRQGWPLQLYEYVYNTSVTIRCHA